MADTSSPNPAAEELAAEAAELWDGRAAAWDARPESHTYAERAFATLRPFVEEHLGPWRGLRVLDFGAGTGLLTAKLAPLCREVVALDISTEMIRALDAKVAREGLGNVAALAGELEALCRHRPELQQPFDLVVASSVCGFLPDFPAEVVRIRSLLCPGGCFVQWDWRRDGGSTRGLTLDGIRAAYAGASLDVVFADIGFLFTFDENEMVVLQAVGRRGPPGGLRA